MTREEIEDSVRAAMLKSSARRAAEWCEDTATSLEREAHRLRQRAEQATAYVEAGRPHEAASVMNEAVNSLAWVYPNLGISTALSISTDLLKWGSIPTTKEG